VKSAVKELQRTAVIGDVHAEHECLARVLEHAREQDVHSIFCVGDIVDGVGDVDRCCALLAEAGAHVVAGNHERWFLADELDGKGVSHPTTLVSAETRAFLEPLPVLRRFDSPAGGVMLCHAVGEDDMAFLKAETRGYALQAIPTLKDLMLDEGVTYMLAGHTHERMVRRFAGLTVVNAGTIHRDWDQGYLIVDFVARRVEPYDLVDGRIVAAEPMDLPEPAPLA
jgi:predicted phosphodiesterase